MEPDEFLAGQVVQVSGQFGVDQSGRQVFCQQLLDVRPSQCPAGRDPFVQLRRPTLRRVQQDLPGPRRQPDRVYRPWPATRPR